MSGTGMMRMGADQQTLSSFVRKVIKEGKPFTDHEFPAGVNSLLDVDNNHGGLDSHSVTYFKKLEWRRASEIYPNGPCIFK